MEGPGQEQKLAGAARFRRAVESPTLVLDPCEIVRARSFGPLEKARSFRMTSGQMLCLKLVGLSSDGLGPGIPGRDCVLEIGVVRQVATDGGVVAEVFVLDRGLAGSHCVEEGCLVGRHVAVTVRS